MMFRTVSVFMHKHQAVTAAGSALLAKGEAFFALCLAGMQPIPSHRAEKTKDTSDNTCDRDERDGRSWIEWRDRSTPA